LQAFTWYLSRDSGVFVLVFPSKPEDIHKLFLPRMVFAALSKLVVIGFPEVMPDVYRAGPPPAIPIPWNVVGVTIPTNAPSAAVGRTFVSVGWKRGDLTRTGMSMLRAAAVSG